MIAALAFVPIADILQSFDDLCLHCVGNEQPFLYYLGISYVGEFRRGMRRVPMFPHVLWNIHRRVVSDLPRTNNILEDWHKAFNKCISAPHPTIWKFINNLRKDAAI